MENGIFERVNVVREYGNDYQINHFEKWGKWKNKDTQASFEKTLDEIFGDGNWGTVKDEGKTKYKLGEKLEERAIREDKRLSNGAWKISYTKNLDIVVVSVLEQGLETNTAQTLASWALDFGVITEKMHDLLQSRYHEGLRETHIKDLKNNSIIKTNEDRIVDDFAQITKQLTNQVAGTLKRMEKAEIIEFYPVYKGHIAKTDTTINLHENVYKQVVALKRRLMEHYDVSEWYLMTYRNSKKTIEFNKEYLEQLAFVEDENGKTLGLDYYYTTYAVILKARKKKIIAYLSKYNKEVIEQFKQDEQKFLVENEQQFHEKRKEHVVNEAQKKANKFLQPKPFKIANEEFGGKTVVRTPTIYDYDFDSDYYALYFEGLYTQRIGELQEYYGYTFNYAN
ncbi:hypothetical protein ABLO26_01855 [Neobacillus sp. 179-J 1A1 HS]|uniref:hypothetical protein n=1 Tax=Neobacillus driksii TaxID=3035913 RepID=UPI0035BBABEB